VNYNSPVYVNDRVGDRKSCLELTIKLVNAKIEEIWFENTDKIKYVSRSSYMFNPYFLPLLFFIA